MLLYLVSENANIHKKIGFNTNIQIPNKIHFQNLLDTLKYDINNTIKNKGGIIIEITHHHDIHETWNHLNMLYNGIIEYRHFFQAFSNIFHIQIIVNMKINHQTHQDWGVIRLIESNQEASNHGINELGILFK